MEPSRNDTDSSNAAALAKYAALLRKDNARLGLVSPAALSTLEESLIAPCLTFTRLAPFHEPMLSIVDLGSGGGFPGIPLAIAKPNHAILLVDSQQKKCDFLRRSVDELELSNVRVLHARIERIRDEAPPDIFIARFFKDIRTIAVWTRHWRRSGTRYLLFSGAQDLTINSLYNLELKTFYRLTEDKVALEYLTI